MDGIALLYDDSLFYGIGRWQYCRRNIASRLKTGHICFFFSAIARSIPHLYYSWKLHHDNDIICTDAPHALLHRAIVLRRLHNLYIISIILL